MGMTLWIHTLEGRSLANESDDHSLMYRHSEALDEVCAAQRVAPLSSFFDTTDLTYNMDEGPDEEDLATLDDADDLAEPLARSLDPETGWAYGIDDMQWFEASQGLETLTALRIQLEAGALPDLDESDLDILLEELGDCIEVLEDTVARNGRFHLAVIM